MTIRAYSRCTSGHYFTGESCPFDNWTSAFAVELAGAVERLAKLGRVLSLEELRRAGLSDPALSRTILIEFGAEGSAFDAVSPKEYHVKGQTKPPMKLGQHFK